MGPKVGHLITFYRELFLYVFRLDRDLDTFSTDLYFYSIYATILWHANGAEVCVCKAGLKWPLPWGNFLIIYEAVLWMATWILD